MCCLCWLLVVFLVWVFYVWYVGIWDFCLVWFWFWFFGSFWWVMCVFFWLVFWEIFGYWVRFWFWCVYVYCWGVCWVRFFGVWFLSFSCLFLGWFELYGVFVDFCLVWCWLLWVIWIYDWVVVVWVIVWLFVSWCWLFWVSSLVVFLWCILIRFLCCLYWWVEVEGCDVLL